MAATYDPNTVNIKLDLAGRPREGIHVSAYVTPTGASSSSSVPQKGAIVRWEAPDGGSFLDPTAAKTVFVTKGLSTGDYRLTVSVRDEARDIDATGSRTVSLNMANVEVDYQQVRPGETTTIRVRSYRGPQGNVTVAKENNVIMVDWEAPDGGSFLESDEPETDFLTSGLPPGTFRVKAMLHDEENGVIAVGETPVTVEGIRPDGSTKAPLAVRLQRSSVDDTPDEILWRVIDDRANAIGWDPYATFMDEILCGDRRLHRGDESDCFNYCNRVDAYRFVRLATEEFLRYQCGILPPDDETPWTTGLTEAELGQLRDSYLQELAPSDGSMPVLPYLKVIRQGLAEVPVRPVETLPGSACYGLSGSALGRPCLIELIWSYWMEQGMLVQTLATLATRFQNRAGQRQPDPLANFELDPLRPAGHLLWGYLQVEHERLSVGRRVYEYLHHYGLDLTGKAIPRLRAAETRSRFLEAFHTLLHVTSRFFRQDDDNTISADAFPVLNALRDLHLILAEGAHNQYGDLPWTARVEMMTEQWILARPEVREFLGSRAMVPYPEAWMPRVDAMRGLQGWGDTSVRHFRELAVSGERLLLSVRFGNWSGVGGTTPGADSAGNWARHWRAAIQDYVHSYRAVTGVDLTLEKTAAQLSRDLFQQPSVHMRQRRAAAPAGG
jgi:hypothetical protein